MQLLILHLIEVLHKIPVMGSRTKRLNQITSRNLEVFSNLFAFVWKSKCIQFVCCIYTLIVVRQNSSLVKFDVICFDQEVKNVARNFDYMFTETLVLLCSFVTETYLKKKNTGLKSLQFIDI